MKLERFDMEINWYGDKIHIIASDDGEWVKASDAEALESYIAELETALKSFAKGSCNCDPGYFVCGKCRLSRFLDENNGNLSGVLKVLCPAIGWRPK